MLPQICTSILRICIGKVAGFAAYICGNFWVTQHNSLFLGSDAIIFFPVFGLDEVSGVVTTTDQIPQAVAVPVAISASCDGTECPGWLVHLSYVVETSGFWW